MFHASGRVHFLGNNERLGFKIKRNRGVSAGGGGYRLHFPSCRFHAGNRIHHGFQVLGGCPTASADDANSVVLNKVLVVAREVLGLQLVHSATALILRQASVGQNRNVFGGVGAQETDRIIHFRRSGGTVQADHVHIERLQSRERRADFRAQEHCARGLDGHLHRNRQPLAGLLHCLKHADQSGLCLKQILGGLDEQNVDAAFDQGGGLFLVDCGHIVELDVTQRGQLGSRPDRSGYKSRLVFGRELLCCFSGDLCCRDVDFRDSVLKVVLGQNDAGAAECIRLNHIAANLKEAGVDVAD